MQSLDALAMSVKALGVVCEVGMRGTTYHALTNTVSQCMDKHASLKQNHTVVCQRLSSLTEKHSSLTTKYTSLQEQYTKLEEVLQRQETQLRKRIGIEQQLRLYSEALAVQMQQKNTSTHKSKKITPLKNINVFKSQKNGWKEKKKEILQVLHKKQKCYCRESIPKFIKTEYIQKSNSKVKKIYHRMKKKGRSTARQDSAKRRHQYSVYSQIIQKK